MKNDMNAFLKTIRHVKPTHVLSMDDEPIKPDFYILDLVSKIIPDIPNINFDKIKNRFDKKVLKWLNTWPGEHYKLITQLLKVWKPELVLEIGTFRGASCLAMKEAIPCCKKIVTYDIIPWNKVKGTHLRDKDFDGSLEQRVVDFSKLKQIETQRKLFENASFIFVDMAKDGVSEQMFCDFLDTVKFKKAAPLVLFDDIRFNSMLKFWRNVKHPKMDITSIGHWSGTGLAHWV
jgi:predicted O-methyltransferase YrrM